MSKVCKLCGADNDASARVCKYCMTPFPNEPAPVQSTPQQTSQAQTIAAQPTSNQPERTQQSSPQIQTQNPTVMWGNINWGNITTPASTAPTTPVNTKPENDFDLFSVSGWESAWRSVSSEDREIGIILTNTAGASKKKEFISALEEYTKYKASQGVKYCLLDLDTQKVKSLTGKIECQNVVDLLRTVYKVKVPDYLLIVGDESVIPRIRWQNKTSDSDANVPSDLPYITLTTDSPWSGQKYDFEDITKVGRIPTDASVGFEDAIKYFTNTSYARKYNKASAFAYSARVWEKTSDNVFDPINAAMITSPLFTSDKSLVQHGLKLMGGLSDDFNLLCFNLHGSDKTHVWYGQDPGCNCLPAFTPSMLPKNSDNGYVICTEACYGARPNVKADSQKSFVLHSLRNGCLAFVGSTRIAYGAANGMLSCADVIACEFSKAVASGDTFGSAFLKSLSALTKQKKMNETILKTVAEFALYGDPSCGLVQVPMKRAKGTRLLSISKTTADSANAFALYSCDGSSGAFSLYSMKTEDMAKIQLMSKKISEKGKEFMLSNFSKVSADKPQLFKVSGSKGYRAVYTEKIGDVESYVQLHLDEEGNIEETYISK